MGWSGKSPKILQMLALITGGICFTNFSRYLLVSISSPCENIYQEVVTVLIVWNSKAHICFVQNCNCHCFSISLFAAGDASLPWKKKIQNFAVLLIALCKAHSHARTHTHAHTNMHTRVRTHTCTHTEARDRCSIWRRFLFAFSWIFSMLCVGGNTNDERNSWWSYS